MLEEQGWIVMWRPAKAEKRQAALYTLTQRGTTLCNRIHKMCVGEEKIPESKSNKMTTSEKPIDKYYMSIVKKMNAAVKK